jgi:hypothetical protein
MRADIEGEKAAAKTVWPDSLDTRRVVDIGCEVGRSLPFT